MTESFDAIVVGGGAMGTAAAYELARRGRRTLLLERFTIGHDRGSSGGPTRIFRFTYGHPDYVRMAVRAQEAWREMEHVTKERLLYTTGGLDIGVDAQRSADALHAAGVPFSWITSGEAMERWPGLRIEPDAPVLLQEDAGVCMSERTVRAQARAAREAGATILEETQIERLAETGDLVEVVTGHRTYRASVAVVTAGPWASKVLRTAGIDLPLVPSLEQVAYFRLIDPSPLPTVVDWTSESTRELMGGSVNVSYALPNPEDPGSVKAGLDRSGPDVDPDDRPVLPDPDRRARVRGWAEGRFGPLEEVRPPQTCMYTNSPDGEFVLDRLGHIVIGSPCSGHGFKFVPLFGAALADMATDTAPCIRLDAFRADREWVRRHLWDRPIDA